MIDTIGFNMGIALQKLAPEYSGRKLPPQLSLMITVPCNALIGALANREQPTHAALQYCARRRSNATAVLRIFGQSVRLQRQSPDKRARLPNASSGTDESSRKMVRLLCIYDVTPRWIRAGKICIKQ
ncbi:MAG: hypothetical protein KKC43_01195 [Alphaproteobacteria bacterium]|nr:hypothetical protein [Alphaproteobacteria bacterium]